MLNQSARELGHLPVGLRTELEERRQWDGPGKNRNAASSLYFLLYIIIVCSQSGQRRAAGLAVYTLEKSLNFHTGIEAVPEHFKAIW